MSIKHKNFFIITVVFSPCSYERRYELYKQFESHIATFGATLITVELTFFDQQFRITNAQNPNHIQLRTNDYMFYKENLINIAIKRLPEECEYVAWIDCDLEFTNLNWINDTITALETYNIVQLFDEAHALGPNNEIILLQCSFGYKYATNVPYPTGPKKQRDYTKIDMRDGWWCGYGTAAKKQTLLNIGGLTDFAIVGSGESVFLSALTRGIEHYKKLYNQAYYDEIEKWQINADKFVEKKIGFIKNTFKHYWHGSYENRGYKARRSILKDFDPKTDIYRDKETGLLHFCDNDKKEFYQSSIKAYFESRSDDN